jgi:DNA polymerase IV
MWPTVQQALHEVMKPHAAYRLAGLALSSLVPAPPGLYDQRRSKAVEAMDAIISRHGAVIGLGGVTDDEQEA